MARDAKALPRQFVDASVKDGRKTMQKALNADTGGDGRLSHAGNAKLTIKTSKSGQSPATGKVFAGKPIAMWMWLEDGTKPHVIGGRWRGAHHPGTRPKRTWSKAAPHVVERASEIAREQFSTLMKG